MADTVILPPLNPRGVFDPTIVYNPNDLVTYFGVPYYCRIGTINGQPITPGSDPNTWQLITVPGAQGLKGDDGDAGDQGPRGRPGVAGADGAGYRIMGPWDAGTAYLAGDVVSYVNSAQTYAVMWFAIAGSTGVVPGSNAAIWGAGVKGDTGDVTQAGIDARNAAQAAAATSTQEANLAIAAAGAASDSATASGQSAAAALASKNAAATSQGNAATSEGNAKTSENNSAASAAAALTSKNAAATSQGNAATSETNAKTSETNSKTSETNSAASAAAAAASAASASGLQFGAPLVINAAGVLTGTALGKAIKYTGAAATVTFMAASAIAAGRACLVANDGTGMLTLAAGAGDQFNLGAGSAASLSLLPGDWVILHGTGVANRVDAIAGTVLSQISRVRIMTTTDDGVSALQVGGSIRATGKIQGVNSENLLFNGSGEVGNAGWTSTIFTGSRSPGFGCSFSNLAALATASDDASMATVCGPNQPICIQSEISAAGLTAGVPQVSVEALDATGASLGTVCTAAGVAGQAPGLVTATALTPANTAFIRAHKQVSGATVTGPIGSVVFRRIKMELGSLPSLYSDENTVNTISTILTTQLAGRNRARNGAMQVTQRATSIVIPTNVTGVGGPDGYSGTNGNAGGQFTQNNLGMQVYGFSQNAIGQTTNVAVADLSGIKYWSGLQQVMEGADVYDLTGKPIAISFWFQAKLTGKYSICVNATSGSNNSSYITTFNYVKADTAQYITAVTAPIPLAYPLDAGVGPTLRVRVGSLNSGTYLTSTLNTWSLGTYLSTPGCVQWGSTVGAYISMAEFQVEPTAVTVFERIEYQRALARAQRYFCKTFNDGVPPAHGQAANGALFLTGGVASESHYCGAQWRFPQPMRQQPTMIFYEPIQSANPGAWYDQATGNVSTPGIIAGGSNGALVAIAAGSSVTIGQSSAWYVHATADADMA